MFGRKKKYPRLAYDKKWAMGYLFLAPTDPSEFWQSGTTEHVVGQNLTLMIDRDPKGNITGIEIL